MFFKAIVIGAIRGLAAVVIFVYTAGFLLVILKVVDPANFLATTTLLAFLGLPLVLVEKYYQKLEAGTELHRVFRAKE